jgi:hypothetical protein
MVHQLAHFALGYRRVVKGRTKCLNHLVLNPSTDFSHPIGAFGLGEALCK